MQVLLHSTSDSIITQLPCFVKLKLKVKPSNILDENVKSLADCFIQKSSMAQVFLMTYESGRYSYDLWVCLFVPLKDIFRGISVKEIAQN